MNSQKMKICHNDFTAVMMSPSMLWLWGMELGWEHDILTAVKLRLRFSHLCLPIKSATLKQLEFNQNCYHNNKVEHSHKKLPLSRLVQQSVICLRAELRRSHNGENSSGQCCGTQWPCEPLLIVTVDVASHCSAISPTDWAKYLKERSNWVTVDTANKHCV